jgi:hypothetical protein
MRFYRRETLEAHLEVVHKISSAQQSTNTTRHSVGASAEAAKKVIPDGSIVYRCSVKECKMVFRSLMNWKRHQAYHETKRSANVAFDADAIDEFKTSTVSQQNGESVATSADDMAVGCTSLVKIEPVNDDDASPPQLYNQMHDDDNEHRHDPPPELKLFTTPHGRQLARILPKPVRSLVPTSLLSPYSVSSRRSVGADAQNTCTNCDKSFVTLTSLQRHRRIVHKETCEHVCDKCDQAFEHTYGLRRHKFSVHRLVHMGQ